VRYPFGHGLSYTTFTYSDLEVSGTGTVTVSCTVTNTGARAGREVVQLYVGDPDAAVRRPVRELRGFDKVTLEPGGSTRVTFILSGRDFAYWDVATDAWRLEGGDFVIEVGASSRDIRLHATINLPDDPALPPLVPDEKLLDLGRTGSFPGHWRSASPPWNVVETPRRAMPTVPSDEEFRTYNQAVISEFRANHGKLSRPPFPILLLTTTGARTGRQTTVPLGFGVDDRGRVFVVGSKAGAPEHPAWFYNLRANPDVTVELGDSTYRVRATVTAGAERDHLYRLISDGTSAYEQNTDRVFPVIVLEGVPAPA
jgi:deazaflavin-dependent oxidoreductase (nitroreductase family)